MGTINVKAIEAKCFLVKDLKPCLFICLQLWYLASYGARGEAATYTEVYFVDSIIE